MDSNLRQQVFRAITNGLAVDDDAYRKIIAAANDVTEEIRSGRVALPVYALIGFDPGAPEASSVLDHVEELVETHWHSLRNSMPDRPVALLRCVLVIGLLEACDDSPKNIGILYLTLRDVLERLTEPKEHELRKDVLGYLRDAHEIAAARTWREGAVFEPSPAVGKLQITVPEASIKALVEGINKAVSGNALNSVYAGQAIESELTPDWRDTFSSGVATAVATAINAMGSEVASKLPRQLRNAEKYHDVIGRILNDAVLSQRQGKLMWWLQAKYSTRLQTSYRNLDSFEGAFYMAYDLHALIPAPVPDEVEAVLHEAIITTYGAEAAKQEEGLQKVMELLASQPDLNKVGAPLQDKQAGRLPLLDVVRLASSTVGAIPDVRQWVGLPADTRMTPVAVALWAFRNAQAEALLK